MYSIMRNDIIFLYPPRSFENTEPRRPRTQYFRSAGLHSVQRNRQILFERYLNRKHWKTQRLVLLLVKRGLVNNIFYNDFLQLQQHAGRGKKRVVILGNRKSISLARHFINGALYKHRHANSMIFLKDLRYYEQILQLITVPLKTVWL